MKTKTLLTVDERALFERWVKENVRDVVPNDEGNVAALVYNLVHLIRGDGDRYSYLQRQDDEIASWNLCP